MVWYSADSNALPQSSVKSIFQDKYGFTWIATENGIVRYDGRNFLVFNNENIHGLSSNRMFSFKGTVAKDSIYIVNDDFEYILINQRSAVKILKEKVPAEYRIDDDLYKYRKEPPKRIQTGKGFYLISRHIIDYRNPDNKILWQVKSETSEFLFFLFNKRLYGIDVQGNFFCFSERGMIKIDLPGARVKKENLIINEVSQQVFLRNGRNLEMLILKNGKPRFQPVLNGYDLSKSNIITALFDKKTQILYVGSSTKGLLIVKKKNFRTLLGDDKDGVYYAQIPFSNSSVLTSSGSLFSNEKEYKKIRFDPDNDEYSLMIDRKGNLWTKSYNVLFCYFKKTNYKTFSKWTFQDKVTQIYESWQGDIFIGTSNGKTITEKGNLYLYNSASKSFGIFMRLNFIPTYMVQNSPHVFWVGSGTGVYTIDVKKKQEKKIIGLQHIQVRSLFPEGHQIWVTTYDKGLFLYNMESHTITKFPLDKNKYLASSHCIIKDEKGFFWISTNKGLFQVSRQNLLNYSLGKVNDIYYHYYDKSEGFNTNEFNGGCQPCGVHLKNHYISFPSMHGIVVFNPDNIKPLLPDNSIYFEEAEIDGVTYPQNSDTLKLKTNFERVRLFLRSPYYGNDNNLKIEVTVKGPVSQSWSTLQDNNITLTSLPPGIYQVTARNLSGFDSKYIYATKILIVPKKIWQTTFFKIIITSILLLFSYYLSTIRLKYLKNQNIILEKKIRQRTLRLDETIGKLKTNKTKLNQEIKNHKRLIEIIAHDIKSPLQFLSILGRHTHYKMQNTDIEDVLKDDIHGIYTTSLQLYNFVENLINYTKISSTEILPELFPVYVVAEEKIKMFRNIAESKKIRLINKIDEDLFLYTNRLLLSVIFHNLIDNALKNTEKGEITFNTIPDSDLIIFMISDTGKGITDDMVKFYSDFFSGKQKKSKIYRTGMGFQMIKELLLLLEAKIEIQSKIDLGTEISIIFQKPNPCKP